MQDSEIKQYNNLIYMNDVGLADESGNYEGAIKIIKENNNGTELLKYIDRALKTKKYFKFEQDELNKNVSYLCTQYNGQKYYLGINRVCSDLEFANIIAQIKIEYNRLNNIHTAMLKVLDTTIPSSKINQIFEHYKEYSDAGDNPADILEKLSKFYEQQEMLKITIHFDKNKACKFNGSNYSYNIPSFVNYSRCIPKKINA